MAVMRICTRLLVLTTIATTTFPPAIVGQITCTNSIFVAIESVQYYSLGGDPNHYASFMNCQMNIRAVSISQNVVLTSLNFSVELYWSLETPNCIDDYVVIYDGPSTNFAIIHKLCGNASVAPIISSGPSMTVVLHSDGANNLRGFTFGFNAQDNAALCENTYLTATNSATNLTSPGYPNSCPSNSACQWVIEADSFSRVVELKLLEFSVGIYSTYCSNDYVTIYDGSSSSSPILQTVCGSVLPSQLISTGRSMTVVFRSGQGNRFKAFRMEYNTHNRPALCSNISLSATSSMSYLTSPNYPNSYPSNIDCQWVIRSDLYTRVVVLSVVNFGLEGPSPSCYNDYVSVHDGIGFNSPVIHKLCGQISSTQFTSTGSDMTVVFHSDRSDSSTGFSFGYTTQEKLALCTNTSLTSTGTAQFFSSPGYPNSYPGNADCQWRITSNLYSDVVVLKLLDFTLDYSTSCTDDYVAIYDGYSSSSPLLRRLCGLNSNTQFTSTGFYMTVVFHSDRSNNYGGFKFQYTSQTKTAACSYSSLTASSSAVYLTSPNYPSPYPSNTDCQWHISADMSSDLVVLDLIQFSLKGDGPFCYSDYVKIYDGPSTASSLIKTLCGSQYDGSYKSTGSDMTVVFHSNGGANYNSGFRLSYKSQEMTTESRPDHTGTVVAIVVSSIAVTCLILVSVVCVRRRITKRQGRGTQNRVPRSLARENSLFIVGQGARGQGVTSPNMGMLDSQSMLEPPPYSSLNFDVNDGLPSYADRCPGYNINDLPPPYTAGLSAPLLNGPRPRKTGAGAAATLVDGAHINGAFNFSDEAVRDESTDQNASAGGDESRDTNLAVSTIIPSAPSSSVA